MDCAGGGGVRATAVASACGVTVVSSSTAWATAGQHGGGPTVVSATVATAVTVPGGADAVRPDGAALGGAGGDAGRVCAGTDETAADGAESAGVIGDAAAVEKAPEDTAADAADDSTGGGCAGVTESGRRGCCCGCCCCFWPALELFLDGVAADTRTPGSWAPPQRAAMAAAVTMVPGSRLVVVVGVDGRARGRCVPPTPPHTPPPGGTK